MRSMRSSRSILNALALGIPLAALLPGCPVYWDGGHDDCDSDLDCPGGSCGADDRCVYPECSRDVDCSSGFRCVDSVCVAGPTSCRTNGDCPVAEYCNDATCAPSGACTGDSACEASFWCDFRGTCVPREPGACRGTSDCSTSQVCVEGRCEDLGDTCQFDRECAAGSACVNNECAAICGSDTDCADGDSCLRGFCRPASECTSSAMCGAGTHCVDGRCLDDCRGAPSSCASSTFCAADDFCRPDWQPTPFCTVDADCDQSVPRACIMGVCRTLCDDFAADCATVDVQFTSCGTDPLSEGRNVCLAAIDAMPECRVPADCGEARACVNGACRND